VSGGLLREEIGPNPTGRIGRHMRTTKAAAARFMQV
jgi:hypothetical protein